MSCIGLNNLQLIQCSKGLIVIFIDTGTNTSTLSSTHTTISIVELNGGTTDTSQCITEQRAKEHIGLTSMNFADVHTHLLHNLHTIAK